ncbi:TIGR01244 family protein [Moraxella cuniculi DSM 21768]|uniref:TIGR01244 family protein n=1 Tax=Moraxella cuniculi DSM 21768 TaxID=1122245 RepID=A0A1N7FXT1_9GAMM|nr:TIGR01244 family sulfur transferase [Moraxella cuniculi]OOS04407.1 TIGR01244 family protein [Moraxella cuniculi]SIS05104.1 TIGR01244 family protein [Moraxella cuniculi DSM 21768]
MSDIITISGQITPDEVRQLAQQGYKTLINNRPDNEEPNQPSSAQIAAVAADCGIAYQQIAFAGGMLEMHHVQSFADFYNQTERPLHIFCRSGNRSSIILQAAREHDLLDD